MPKPEVEKIEGIPPAIAVHQRTINRNPRSTVGTMTEIYEYLKLLYTKIGKTFSPVSGMEVKRDSVSNVVDAIMENYANEKTYILCPVLLSKKEKFEERLNVLLQLGYTRLFLEGEIERIDTILQNKDLQKNTNNPIC